MPARETYLQAVGRVSVAFNQLELEAEQLVHWLIGDVGLGRAITSSKRFDPLIELIRELARYRWRGNTEALQVFETWSFEAKALSTRRHRVIHSIAIGHWQQSGDEWREVVDVVRRGGREPISREAPTVEELSELAEDLGVITARGFRLQVDYAVKVKLPDQGDGVKRHEGRSPWEIPVRLPEG